MTEAQTWTAIGVLSAVLLGGMTLVTTVLMRSIRGQISSLRNEMVSGFAFLRVEMGARFEALDARFLVVDARFDTVRNEIKGAFDSLDKDMQALARHIFGAGRP